MQLHWRLKLMDKLFKMGTGTPMHEKTPVEARGDVENPSDGGFIDRVFNGKQIVLHEVRDAVVEAGDVSIPIRIYRPNPNPNLPVLCFFHGGGWVVGSLNGSDHVCRRIVQATGMIVVATEYRLAPEHKFPEPLDDCFAVTKWASENASSFGGDGSKLTVIGDSAGGNLAAAVALKARDEGAPAIQRQVLIYPVTSAVGVYPEDVRDAPILTQLDMQYYIKHYIRDEADRTNAYVAVLSAESHKNLPPALIITAQYDPLRAEGFAYAEALQKAGVATTYSEYKGMIHAFLSFPKFAPPAKDAYAEIGNYLRAAFEQA